MMQNLAIKDKGNLRKLLIGKFNDVDSASENK
jgi:hypothetical protein